MENIVPQTANHTIKDTTPVKCEKCDNKVFTPVFFLRKVNKLLIGTPEDVIMPIQFGFSCAKCGHINKEFESNGIEDEFKEEENNSSIII